MTKFGKISLIVLIVILLGIVIFFLQRKTAIAPEAVYVDTTMPVLEDKNSIQGNRDDLISFSILPNTKVHGVLSYRGVIQGGYFFEGNILVNILDENKVVLKSSNAIATTDWMTTEPVDFEGNIDFSNLPKGVAFFEIHNDNASGLPEHDKSILIPIVIE